MGRAVLVLVVVLAASGCGTPSRRLPVRAVHDPITLPRRMMEVTLGASGTFSDELRERSSGPLLGYSYGITDRLTWRGVLALEYALLDDAPVEYAATGTRAAGAPLGLSIKGGLEGFGFSSVEGTLVFPTLGVSLVRHLGERFTVDGGASWTGGYSDLRRESWTYLRAGVAFQWLERVVLRLSAFDRLEFGSFGPDGWRQHTAGVAFGTEFRPAHWIDLGAGVRMEGLWNHLQPPPPPLPSEPSPLPVRRPGRRFPILWASVWAVAHW